MAAPDLVVEILSEHTESIDREKKKELYERHGVKEYWLVAPETRQIEQFHLKKQILVHKTTAGLNDRLSSTLLNNFIFEIKKVFAD